ncbi:hypothetical protein QCD60_18835 [Pokkaliibacter sp. MBI-7]|uniref:hypothetical protein n=1 Tax=Pokkaliibacter sp. MBI-7 TaxID=3040600 RepID=UPI002449E124|nr:hypothetical protein [Pokkaliibacter sp. MBI-7]MDH2434603.1 hypothetical protein [Pokkaliibacter sp. MBI-7]
MNYSDLDTFKEDVDSLEEFFTEFAAREDEILTFGMKKVSKWESYEKAAPHLRSFEPKIHEFQSFLRPIDKQLFERVRDLVSDSKLIESISGIDVALRIAVHRKKLSFGNELVSSLAFQIPYLSNAIRRKKLFSEEVIPIQKLLVSLGRLGNLVVMSKESYIHGWSHDSDVFKPSNLSDERIIFLIESAIEEIEINSPLSKDDKKQLVEYLCKAKGELSEDRPSWNKIVGALVIAAAITSGLADSSGAYKNIDAAIKYIIGSSIEKHVPKSVPLLDCPREEQIQNDEPHTISV